MIKLNEEQREAVLHRDGPLLALAGAGSGKTRVITERIAHLINTGIDPSQILAVTFTNKAATEMRERIGSLLKGKPKNLVVSTFHSFCLRVLKTDIEILGYKKNFTIYSQSDCKTLVRSVMRELKVNTLNYDEGLILWYIDNWKNKLVKPNEITPLTEVEGLAARVYEQYQKYLKGYNALDFNDLINLTIELFINNPDILKKYQERFRYIMVDEYQDTNDSQYRLISLLASKYKNIVVVGDDDQSIYAFRGANIKNILSFEEEYKDARVITLTKNYRSTKAILNAAYAVISKNTERKDKKVEAQGGDGVPPFLVPSEDEASEAAYVGDQILNKISSTNAKFKDFAILFRMNAQSRAFEEALRIRGISYTVVGAFQFYERKEIKDLLSYLNLFVNPEDEVSLLRVINLPKRGIGSTAINNINEYSMANNKNLYEALYEADNMDIPAKAKEGVKDFLSVIDKYKSIFEYDKNDLQAPKLYENINNFLEEIAYHSEVLNTADTKESGAKKLENVESLMNSILDYEKSVKFPTLRNYLDRILLMSMEDKEDDNKNTVTLMSIHASKGLEFPYVFLVGMEDGILPHHKSSEPSEIEEERRLCYVAMTRAKKELTITYCLKRRRMGKEVDTVPSKFLEEMEAGIEANPIMDEKAFFESMKEKLKP